MSTNFSSLPIGGHTVMIAGKKAIAELHRKEFDLGEIRYLEVGTQAEVLTVHIRPISGDPSGLVFFDTNFWIVQINGRPTQARTLGEVVQIAGKQVGFHADPNLGILNFTTHS